MSWSGWSARLNVTSIVSQGLEQVSKLKEDVEKQFDQAVQHASKTGTASSPSAGAADGALSASNGGLLPVAALSSPDLFGNGAKDEGTVSSSPSASSSQLLPAPLILKTVDDINVIKSTQWGSSGSGGAASALGRASLQLQQLQQPPYSADGKRRPSASHVDFLADARTPAFTAAASTGALEAKADKGDAASITAARVEPASGGSLNGEGDVDAARTSQGDHVGDIESDKGDGRAAVEADAGTGDGVIELPAGSATADEDEDEEEKVVPDTPTNPGDDVSDGYDQQVQLASHARQHDRGDEENGADEDIDQRGSPGTSIERDVLFEQEGDDPDVEPSENEAAPAQHEHNGTELLIPSDTPAMANEISSLRQHLKAREDQLMATSSTIQELHDELDKTCQREVTAVERARFLTEQLELMRLEVSKLNRMATGQRDSDLQAIQLALSEKDEKLKALLEEGQALSIKQAQFEQRVRQLRKEKNEEEELRLKLQVQYDTAAAQLQNQSAKLKAVEEDNKKFVQEIRQLHSTVDTATKQLSKAEQDAVANETQLQQLKAEVELLSQRNSEMQQELDEMKDASHSNAALSSEKSELEQTIHFLHQSLQDIEDESSRREDMARAEIQDLKRKWQDAVGRVDMMGQSVSDATQPLLRQINALQEDQRARQETWRATEATLLQRVQEASETRRALEQDKLQRDELIHALQSRIEALEQDLKRRASELAREKDKAASALVSERECQVQLDTVQTERDEWRSRFQAESHAKEQLQLRVNNERKKAPDAGSATQQADAAAAATELEEAKTRETQLRHDLEWHQTELRRVKLLSTLQPPTSTGSSSGVGSSRGSSSHLHRGSMNSDDGSSNATAAETQASILKLTLETGDDDTLLGGTSVLGMSQLQQRLRLKEGENRLVKQQLSVLEAKQSQLTEEIVRLSTRNALLETNETRFQQTQEELAELKQRQHVLLELFGEKEEQVEELQVEVGELKAFYRQQLDTLAKHQEQQQ